MVKRTILMNEAMYKIYLCEKTNKNPKYSIIKSIIEEQLLNLQRYAFEDSKQPTELSNKLSYLEVIQQLDTMSGCIWENEFYFGKKILNGNWRESIREILQIFESILSKMNSGNKFTITIIGQTGELENLNVRLQLFKEDRNIDEIECYQQPILVEILEY